MTSNLPPGTTHAMIEAQAGDGPCAVCARTVEECICPECPECGQIGDPGCYGPAPEGHIHHFTRDQLIGQERGRLARAEAEAEDCRMMIARLEDEPDDFIQETVWPA